MTDAPRCPRYGEPPYWAVLFASVRTAAGDGGASGEGARSNDGYAEAAARMEELATAQAGYVGLESARDADGFGLTISYWQTREAAAAWKQVAEHRAAQAEGRARWYADYTVRIARVEKAYDKDSAG